MSAIHIHLDLTYPNDDTARLVFEAFSQWPTETLRSKKPDTRRLKAIKCSMDWIGYDMPHLYQRVFEQEVCHLVEPPVREGNTIRLYFYCGKRAGWQFWEEVYVDLGKIPVTIHGHFMYDMTGLEDERTETFP